jgi:predicted nuclease with TOPRIM domain
MEPEKLRELEDLKRQLKSIEMEEAQLEEQMAILRKRKASILTKLNEKSDEQYEADMLARVYEQRRNQS